MKSSNGWTPRMWRHHYVIGLSLFLGLSVGSMVAQDKPLATGCAANHYRIVPIPLRPHHLNNAGAVAGMTGQHRAALWTAKGGLRTIDLPPGFHHAEGIDINDREQLLGTASTANGSQQQSFLFEDGKLTLLPADIAKANAINANGDLAGEARAASGASSGPLLWKHGKAISLGACCGGRATSLNDHALVAGEAYDQQGRYQAFVWEPESGLKLIGPADTYSTAVAVNEQGAVVVYAFTQGSSLYQNGKLIPMELSKRWPSQPRSINRCNVVVGSFGANSDESEAFLWDAKNGFRNLNDLVPKNSGWKLEAASSINEHGEIAGWGDHGGEDDAGFLLIPEAP